MDRPWWKQHYSEVLRLFKGRLLTVSDWGKRTERVIGEFGGNSGAGAMCLAAEWGARRVIMVGYDCEYAPDGKRHWHGDHPKALGNCVSIGKFPTQFARIVSQLSACEVLNASRHSILDFWPRIELEKALAIK